MLSQEEVDEIVNKCLAVYNKLPKCGKPVENEWTVLSCVVLNDLVSRNKEIVSLGTGSKCVGACKMSPKGDILNDSHAEVFARRSFLLYIYNNINKAIDNEPSIFYKENNKFKLKDNLELIFYSSQLPCGDASIVPILGVEEHYGQEIQPRKRHAQSNIDICPNKMPNDIYRTGAKCLADGDQDPLKKGLEYHTTGVVRTKPGRGDRTLSMSCSDKMARWVHCGIEGSLLNLLIESIYIKHFIFGSGVPYSKETICRALLNRNKDYNTVPTVIPEIYKASVIFPAIKNEINIRPAPGSISWCQSKPLDTEVAVQGRKIGLTKKALSCPRKSLSISKYNLYSKFLLILAKYTKLKEILVADKDLNTISYNEMKLKSTKYYENWTKVKENFFRTWTVKPDMWDFCVSIT